MRRKRSLRGLGATKAVHTESAASDFRTAIYHFKEAQKEMRMGKGRCGFAFQAIRFGNERYGRGSAHAEGAKAPWGYSEGHEGAQMAQEAANIDFIDKCMGMGRTGMFAAAPRRRRRSR